MSPTQGRAKRHRIRPDRLTRARELRRAMTFPERLLWSRLRACRAAGLKWRRQAPIGAYVADYYCAAAALVVEVDGLSHAGREAHDKTRTESLAAIGLHVIRVTNDEVLRDLDAVVQYITALAEQRLSSRREQSMGPGNQAENPTLPQPLPEREGS